MGSNECPGVALRRRDLPPQKTPRLAADGERVGGFADFDGGVGLHRQFRRRERGPAKQVAATLQGIAHDAVGEAVENDAEQPARDGQRR